MITNILLISLIFFIIILPFVPNEKVEYTYSIEESAYTSHLRMLKLYLQTNIRVLNNYLQNDNVDENCLVEIIERSEYQLEKINDLLTGYGRVKEQQND